MMSLIAMKLPACQNSEALRDDERFGMAIGLDAVPSAPTLRQRLDAPSGWSEAVNVSSDVLLKQYAEMTPVAIGAQRYIPLDLDVSPMDNSKTHKEGVS